MTTDQRADRLAGQAAFDWWNSLHGDDAKGQKGDRAALAQLRRMGTLPEALTDPRVMDLIGRVGTATGWRVTPTAWWIAPTVVTAVTLSHLRKSGAKPMAEVLGRKPDKDAPARYSGLRFTRLIRAESDEERLIQLGRVARRLRADDVPVDVSRLATDLFRLWSNPDWVRRDWTFQYHQMTAAAPKATAEQDEVAQ